MTWKSAQEQCKLAGGHLATPNTKAKNEFIKQQFIKRFGNSDVGQFWFGAMAPLRSKSKEGWKYITGELMTHDDWLPNQPLGDGKCITYWSGGRKFRWNDAACEFEKHNFICESSTWAYTAKSGYRSHFRVKFDKKNRLAAEQDCRLDGGHLAIPNHPATNEYIKQQFIKRFGNSDAGQFWFGAMAPVRSKSKKGWKFYVTGEWVNYDDWANGQPAGDGRCITYWSDGRKFQWNDAHCKWSKFAFICEAPNGFKTDHLPCNWTESCPKPIVTGPSPSGSEFF